MAKRREGWEKGEGVYSRSDNLGLRRVAPYEAQPQNKSHDVFNNVEKNSDESSGAIKYGVD